MGVKLVYVVNQDLPRRKAPDWLVALGVLVGLGVFCWFVYALVFTLATS